MPVRINLLAEVIAAEDERRNDPVKRAVWIGVFFVFLVMLWYSMLLVDQMVASSRLEEKKTEWSRLEPANKELRIASNGIRESLAKISALDRLATNRFLWAPVLNALQYTMVQDHVRLVHLSGTHTYVVVLPPKEDSKKKAIHDDESIVHETKKKKSKPASSTEKILLTLDARDYSAPADQSYNGFIRAIGQSVYFKNSLESGGVNLAKLLPPTTVGGDTDKSFTQFTVECRFPEKERK
jgi:hypothetical protein